MPHRPKNPRLLNFGRKEINLSPQEAQLYRGMQEYVIQIVQGNMLPFMLHLTWKMVYSFMQGDLQNYPLSDRVRTISPDLRGSSHVWRQDIALLHCFNAAISHLPTWGPAANHLAFLVLIQAIHAFEPFTHHIEHQHEPIASLLLLLLHINQNILRYIQLVLITFIISKY